MADEEERTCLFCSFDAEASPVYRMRQVIFRVRGRGRSAQDRFSCRMHLAPVVGYVAVPGQTVDVERLA